MKKFLTVVITFLLGVIIGIGGYLGVKKLTTPKQAELNLTVKTMHLGTEYNVGDDVSFDVIVFSDVKLVRLTYVLDNGTETDVKGAEFGASVDHELSEKDSGRYYIDSNLQTIKSTDMDAGFHSLIFYAYTSENELVDLMEQPIQFKLVEVQAAA